MEGCPGETELLDLVAGSLGRAEADSLHEHLAGCASCERMVAELASESASESARADSR